MNFDDALSMDPKFEIPLYYIELISYDTNLLWKLSKHLPTNKGSIQIESQGTQNKQITML